MKKPVLLITLFAFALMFAPAVQAETWVGWITDDHCGAKGAKAEHKSCAIKCLGDGAALVFYNSADKNIYTLDKQDLAKEHLGSEVKVTGEADGEAIKVESIAFVESR